LLLPWRRLFHLFEYSIVAPTICGTRIGTAGAVW
jgi:hypothetical protein